MLLDKPRFQSALYQSQLQCDDRLEAEDKSSLSARLSVITGNQRTRLTGILSPPYRWYETVFSGLKAPKISPIKTLE